MAELFICSRVLEWSVFLAQFVIMYRQAVARFSAFICQFPTNRTNKKFCVKELISANLDNAEVEIQHPKESSEGWGSLPFKNSLKFTWQVNPDRTERPPLQEVRLPRQGALKETISQPLCQLKNKCSNSLRPRYVQLWAENAVFWANRTTHTARVWTSKKSKPSIIPIT